MSNAAPNPKTTSADPSTAAGAKTAAAIRRGRSSAFPPKPYDHICDAIMPEFDKRIRNGKSNDKAFRDVKWKEFLEQYKKEGGTDDFTEAEWGQFTIKQWRKVRSQCSTVLRVRDCMLNCSIQKFDDCFSNRMTALNNKVKKTTAASGVVPAYNPYAAIHGRPLSGREYFAQVNNAAINAEVQANIAARNDGATCNRDNCGDYQTLLKSRWDGLTEDEREAWKQKAIAAFEEANKDWNHPQLFM